MKKRGRNLFIVLEGLSGSGKSTVAKLLAKKLHAKLYKTPSGAFGKVREAVDLSNPSTLARFYFYLAGIMQASEEIKGALLKSHVICDRYVLTTFCYHKILTTHALPSPNSLPLTKPDFTFLITCKERNRLTRLRKRGLSFNDKRERSLHVEKSFLKEYRRFRPIEISNDLDPKTTVEKIVGILEKR